MSRVEGDYKLHIIQALIHIKKLEVCLRLQPMLKKKKIPIASNIQWR